MSVKWNRVAAYQYLQRAWSQKREFQSIRSRRIDLSGDVYPTREIFSSMIILDLLAKYPLDNEVKSGLISYLSRYYRRDNLFSFYEEGQLPPDVDVTAMGVASFTQLDAIERSRASDSVNKILSNKSSEGLISVFFAPFERVDAVVCANALYVIYLYGQEDQAKKTENFIYSLLHEADEKIVVNIPYYCSPDTFLYAISRLIVRFPNLRKKFAPALKKKLEARIGTTDHLLDLAMRTIVAKAIGIDNVEESAKLADAQSPHGYWMEAPFFTDAKEYGIQQYYGCKALSSAFCIRALEVEQ